MKKRLLSLLLALALACTLLPAASLAAGSSTSDATPASFGETVEGEITEKAQQDYYKIVTRIA